MSMRCINAALAAALATALAPAAFAQTALAPGGTLQVNIPPTSFSNDVYIDVPAGAERLTVTLQAANSQQDVDMLVRWDSTFPSTTPDAEFLVDHAQYVSAGAEGNESITITRASAQPLRAGRLHLSIINFASAAAPATLRATLGAATDFVPITVVFDDAGTPDEPCGTAGWNDATPRSPVRGNSGTTLGQQRRLAMQEAARLLSEEIRPAVPIVLRGCWSDLGATNASGGTTLAQARPRTFNLGDRGLGGSARRPYLASQYTFYSVAAVAHQSGTATCNFSGGRCSDRVPDIIATFNTSPDTQSTESRRFDYGFTASGTSATGSSYISTAMHEIAHGLGFAGLIGFGTSVNGAELGARVTPYDDIYGANAAVVGLDARAFLRVTDAERAVVLRAGNELRFVGPATTSSAANPFVNFAPPQNSVPLHTPATLAPGSSYSHFAQFETALTGQMMLPSIPSTAPRTLGLARNVLQDLGWVAAARSAPTFATPPDTQYYDVSRNGHGIDFRRVAGTTDLYFLGVYSYDAAGNPEWYTALGRIVDGLFVPARNEFGDSLVRSLFRAGQTPQSVPESSAAFDGQIRIDFVQAAKSPACYNAVPGRSYTGTLAVMSFILDGEEEPRQWCMQPLLGDAPNVDVDLGSVWFNPSDPGWGITVLSLPGNGGDGMAVGVYYPDATGKGRWGIVQTDRYVPGQSYPVMQVRGYPRGGAAPATLETTQIGTLTLNIGAPNSGQPNTLSLDVTYPGTEGGRFVRTNAPLTPANEPAY